MKNKFISSISRYNDQVVRKAYSLWQPISLAITVILLAGSLASCNLTNTSRWKMGGYSMVPNLSDGQIVVVQPVDDVTSLQRGDIIIFEWKGNTLLKRLVALPGEIIEIRQGHIVINGEVYDEPYDVIPPNYEREPLKLGKDEYYVLGDNRNDSKDSHDFGPITSEMIIGRVIQ